MKPPRLGMGLAGGMPGLGALLTSDDDMDACSAAAQAALSAARLAGYRSSTSGTSLHHDCMAPSQLERWWSNGRRTCGIPMTACKESAGSRCR